MRLRRHLVESPNLILFHNIIQYDLKQYQMLGLFSMSSLLCAVDKNVPQIEKVVGIHLL